MLIRVKCQCFVDVYVPGKHLDFVSAVSLESVHCGDVYLPSKAAM